MKFIGWTLATLLAGTFVLLVILTAAVAMIYAVAYLFLWFG